MTIRSGGSDIVAGPARVPVHGCAALKRGAGLTGNRGR